MIALDWFNIILIGGALHGVFLLFAINSIKDRNKGANRYLSMLIVIITVALLGRVTFKDIILQDYPQVLMLPDIVLFLFGPILYFYVSQLLTSEKIKIWPHLLVAGAHYTYMILVGCRSSEALWEMISSGVLMKPMYGILMLGIIHSGIYSWLSYRKLFIYQKESRENLSFDARISYLHLLLGLIVACLVVWGYALLTTLFAGDAPNFFAYKIIWVGLTILVYVMGFFAVKQPELFKLAVSSKKYQGSNLSSQDIHQMGKRLDQLMQAEKPFLNPKLTKSELATMAKTNTSNISRVINEGFGKNFFDFINAYRIQEFIRLVKEEGHHNYTYLAIAEEVGFNSKTTFYTAFKKLTNHAPREYFKTGQSLPEDLITLQS